MPRRRFPVHLYFQVIPGLGPLRGHIRSAGNLFDQFRRLQGESRQGFLVAAEDLQPQIGTDAGGKHVDPVDDRHGPAIGHPGNLQLFVQLPHQLFRRHPRTPPITRFQEDDRLEHGEG